MNTGLGKTSPDRMSETTVDCLIIGGGPTGLTLGIGLLRSGKSVVIAEKHLTGLGYSKAILVSTDSLKALRDYGVTSRIQSAGIPLDGFSLFVHEKLLSASQFDTTQAYHPYILPQEATENCLRDVYLEHGGKIMLGYAFEPEENPQVGKWDKQSPMTVTLVNKQCSTLQRTNINCRWLFGCDGIHSSVRKSLDIGYPGSTVTEQQNSICDVEVAFWPFDTLLTMWFATTDSAMMLKISSNPVIVRIVGTTEAAKKKLLQGLAVKKVLWDSSFVCSYKLADKYGRGNVWLAGDACHVHSPLGGRGMNTGISDAIALAEAVQSGDLQRYEDQRRPVARHWVWKNYFLSQVAMGRGKVFNLIRYCMSWVIRGAALVLGSHFPAFAVQYLTTSVVKSKPFAALEAGKEV